MTTALVLRSNESRAVGEVAKPRCERGIIKPLPVNTMMDVARRFAAYNEVDPNIAPDYSDVEAICHVWDNYSNRFLTFNQWTYDFFPLYEFDSGYVTLQVRIKHKYLPVCLVAIAETIDMAYGYTPPEQRRYPAETIYDWFDMFNWLGHLLEKANEAVIEWNTICLHSMPIFNEPLPEKELEQSLKNGAFDVSIEYAECEYGKENGPEYDRFEVLDWRMKGMFESGQVDDLIAKAQKWIGEGGTLGGWDLSYILGNYWDTSFGKRGDWSTFIHLFDSDACAYYQVLVARPGVKMAFCLLDDFIDHYGYGQNVDIAHEYESFVHSLLEVLRNRMIRWNEYMTATEEKVKGMDTVSPEHAPDFAEKYEPNEYYLAKVDLDPESYMSEEDKLRAKGYIQLKLPLGEGV